MELTDMARYVFVGEVVIFEDAYWCCRLRITKSIRLMLTAHPLRLPALLLRLLLPALSIVVVVTTALLPLRLLPTALFLPTRLLAVVLITTSPLLLLLSALPLPTSL